MKRLISIITWPYRLWRYILGKAVICSSCYSITESYFTSGNKHICLKCIKKFKEHNERTKQEKRLL